MSLSHLAWRATEFILAFGPLTPSLVLDYFVLSPFFDRTSTNAQLRMQMQFSRGGMEGVDEEGELRRFVGIEYAVVRADPPGLFIIHKRDRISSTQATTIAAYYVLNDSIYQGPTLYSVLNERLLTSLHALSTSLSLLQEHKPTWTPEKLYAWEVRPGSGGEGEEEREGEEGERPKEMFNPMLFRALKAVEKRTEEGERDERNVVA